MEAISLLVSVSWILAIALLVYLAKQPVANELVKKLFDTPKEEPAPQPVPTVSHSQVYEDHYSMTEQYFRSCLTKAVYDRFAKAIRYEVMDQAVRYSTMRSLRVRVYLNDGSVTMHEFFHHEIWNGMTNQETTVTANVGTAKEAEEEETTSGLNEVQKWVFDHIGELQVKVNAISKWGPNTFFYPVPEERMEDEDFLHAVAEELSIALACVVSVEEMQNGKKFSIMKSCFDDDDDEFPEELLDAA